MCVCVCVCVYVCACARSICFQMLLYHIWPTTKCLSNTSFQLKKKWLSRKWTAPQQTHQKDGHKKGANSPEADKIGKPNENYYYYYSTATSNTASIIAELIGLRASRISTRCHFIPKEETLHFNHAMCDWLSLCARECGCMRSEYICSTDNPNIYMLNIIHVVGLSRRFVIGT